MINKVVILEGLLDAEIDVTQYIDNGLSTHDKLAESLDEGQATLGLIDREEEFTMFDTITFYTDEGITTYLISNDDVEITSRRPTLYDHKIYFVEPTKMLERFRVNGFKTIQPTDENATKLTLYDEIFRLRRTHPLEILQQNETSRLFDIPEETKSVLETVIAPELTLPPMSLREAIDKYLGVIDGIARIDGNRNLYIDFFNETLDAVALLDDDFNEKRRSKTIEFNTQSLTSRMLNVINDNEFSQAVEVFPAKGQYTTIRSNKDSYYLDFLNANIPTPKPINYINRLYALVFTDITLSVSGGDSTFSLTDFPLDLNIAQKGYEELVKNRILEYDVYRQKDFTGLAEDILQTNTLYYEQYKPNIKVGTTSGLFDITTNLDLVITEVFNDWLRLIVQGRIDEFPPLTDWIIDAGLSAWIRDGDLIDPDFLGNFASPPTVQNGFYYYNTTSDEYFVGVAGTWEFTGTYDPVANKSFVLNNSNDLQKTPFQVHFQPVNKSLTVNVEKTYTTDVFYKLGLLANQRSEIIDINDYMGNMQGRVNRLGETELEATHIVDDLSKRLKIGSVTPDNFILIERETIYYKDSVIVKYLFSKNFNRIAQYFGVNSQVRQWDIPLENQTIERDYIYKDYCIISAHGDIQLSGEFTPNALTTIGKNTFLETLYDQSTLDQVRGGYISFVEEQIQKLVYISVGSNGTRAGNLVFDFKARDTQTVGDRIVTETNVLNQDGLEGVRYTDSDGKIEFLNAIFISELNVSRTPTEILRLSNKFPELESSQITGVNNLISFNDLVTDKSAGEIMGLVYQLDSFPKDKDIYIGETFYKRNRLINENNFVSGNLKIFGYVDKSISDIKLGKLPATGVGDEVVTNLDIIVGTNIIANTITIDETKNQYIVTVQELDGKTMWALTDEDDNILFAVNQDPIDIKYIIQFDFVHERPGTLYPMFVENFPFFVAKEITISTDTPTYDIYPYEYYDFLFNKDVIISSDTPSYDIYPYEYYDLTFDKNIVVSSDIPSYSIVVTDYFVDSNESLVTVSTNLPTYSILSYEIFEVTNSTSISIGSNIPTYSICDTFCEFVTQDSYFSATDETFDKLACGQGVERTICTYDIELEQWFCTDYLGNITTNCIGE